MSEGNQWPKIQAVVFDVGETLVDESRAWWDAAVAAGVTPFTLMGALGATIERGVDHREAWNILGVEAPVRGPDIRAEDFYSDAISVLQELKSRGYLMGLAGNQPAGVERQLSEAGCEADFIASSAQWGVSKPAPEFFTRILDATGLEADQILYVGDRLDNDVLPAHRAGMLTALIRRGPWGHLHVHHADAARADAQIENLTELLKILPGTEPSRA